MYLNYEILLIKRFLFSKKSDGYISIFSWFSILGIMIGVSAIIIVMSVMNGFREELTSRLLGINGHINIFSNTNEIDQNILENAIETLVNAERVEFYAFGGSAPVAMDGQHKFFRLKISSSYISDPHLQFMSANSLEKNDVVVAISQSGTTAALIDSVKIVRKNGVKVIGIMPGNTPLANICDFPLTIDVGINNRISKPVTSRIAYTAVIDVLTMGVAQLKPEAQEHLYNIADSQRSLKIDN